MNAMQVERRILRMVRLLGALGLAMVAILIAQIGFELKSIHTNRQRLQEQRGQLNQGSQAIQQCAVEARQVIQGVLNENIPLSQRSDAVTKLSKTIHQLLTSTDDTGASATLQRLDSLAHEMTALEQRSLFWRGKYDVVWQDVSQNRTLDILELRREGKKLEDRLTVVSHDIDSAEMGFVESTHARSQALTEQMERILSASWREMIAVGGGCSVLFIWLAWLISRAIRDQVKVIEVAKSEAESGRQEASRTTWPCWMSRCLKWMGGR
jgi:hypothetical protein